MKPFIERLDNEIRKSVNNHYTDNVDFIKFPHVINSKRSIRTKISNFFRFHFYDLLNKVKPLVYYSNSEIAALTSLDEKLEEEIDKDLLVKIIAYRKLGFHKVKLPLSNASYWKKFYLIDSKVDKADFIDPHFSNFILYKHKFDKLDIELYFTSKGVLTDLELEQYAYRNKSEVIGVKEGDIVIDAGGCWGDTALYFAAKIGKKGAVYSFEFIPSNVAIFKKNINLNPHLKETINLVENPVWEKSGVEMYYLDNGPASKVSFNEISAGNNKVRTKSIDDLVLEKNIQKIDFIKMDIEGAEPNALKGAVDTIKRFKPVLAIAIYHSMDDFINIPKWIDALDLGYKFYLGHYTIHSEETILFAKVK
jgi:FkbM family methyltransferase